MSQPIQQSGCHLFIYKHRGPLSEAEVGGNDDAGAFIEFADQVEQQCTTRLTKASAPAGVVFEDRQVFLGHTKGSITTHYSGPEIQNLIEAANKVCQMRPEAVLRRVL